MKRVFISFCLLFSSFLSASTVLADVDVTPETVSKVKMSVTDVNRMVCSGEISDVVYSKEKGLTVKVSGGNIYLKFPVLSDNEEGPVYAETPSEIYVTCDGVVYTIIAVPERMPPVVVRFRDAKRKIRKNLSVFKGLALEESMAKFIMYAYRDDIPESFDVITVVDPKTGEGRRLKKFPALKASLKRIISASGEGLTLREFYLYPESNMEVRETDFLLLAKRPAAVALSSAVLEKGKVYRLFIVDYSTDGPGDGGF